MIRFWDTGVEIIGAVLSVIYLYLSVKQKVSLWIYGFLCSALYIIVFFRAKIYADMTIQVYYLAVSVYGWISWKTGKMQTGHEIPVKRTSTKQWTGLALFSAITYLAYYFSLVRFTDSPVPILDSFTAALSITATWMLAKKLIEQWIIWIVVDSVSIALYFYRELYTTAVLFILYTIMAIVGYYQWKKSLNSLENEQAGHLEESGLQ